MGIVLTTLVWKEVLGGGVGVEGVEGVELPPEPLLRMTIFKTRKFTLKVLFNIFSYYSFMVIR